MSGFKFQASDWIALVALLLSVWFGLFAPLIAGQVNPSIDFGYPTSMQFSCAVYNDESKRCDGASLITLTVHPFSFWSKPSFSRKSEIVQDIDIRLAYGGEKEAAVVPYDWKYVTDITDVAASSVSKRNIARFVVDPGKLISPEIQFVVDLSRLDDHDSIKSNDTTGARWATFLEVLRALQPAERKIQAYISIDLEHTEDLMFKCDFGFDLFSHWVVEDESLSSSYFVGRVQCGEA